MSQGIVVCSICMREVHQTGRRDENGKSHWEHCEDRTLMCPAGNAVYPSSVSEIQGKWCGCDEMLRL